MVMLRNIARIEVLYAKIHDNLKQTAEIEQRKIQAIRLRPNLVLHAPIYTKNKKWLDEQIDGK